jgi:phosphoserine aminotransferase
LVEKKSANYLVTGHWGEKAIAEANKYCSANAVVPLKVIKDNKYTMTNFPTVKDWNYDANGAYFHYCDNETIAGVEFNYTPVSLD